MRADALDVSVVIPAWNECENLRYLLPELRRTLTELKLRFELLVVDAGSNDGTAELVAAERARYLVQRERGYGSALLEGFHATTAPYVITMDADLSHQPIFIHDFWLHRDDADMLIASRYVPGGSAEMPAVRAILSRLLNVVYARVLALPLHDLSSGYRMYRRATLEGLTLVGRDFDALEEILIRIYTSGWRVREVPFHYAPRGAGGSHARLLRLARAFLRTLLRMWWLRHRRRPRK